MVTTQNSILPLIEEWEAFQNEHPTNNLTDFAQWLLQRSGAEPVVVVPSVDEVASMPEWKSEMPQIPDTSGIAAYMIVRLYKAFRFYVKPILHQHNLAGVDDFFFLATLLWKSHINKKMLCHLNMTDIPTGIDIIKRLVAQGLVAEVDNDLDKRQKLLHITPQGAQVAYEVFGATQHLPKILGDLDAQQGMDVLRQLDHLNHLHTQIYQQQSK